MLLDIDYKGYKYVGALYPNFGSYRIYMKPVDYRAALYAEGLEQTLTDSAQSKFVEYAESDFNLARYRLDGTSDLKLSTTLGNKLFASSVIVALSAASTLCNKARSRNSMGEYSAEWRENVVEKEISAELTFRDGLLSSGTVRTADLTINLYPSETDPSSLTPQHCIIAREVEARPCFNSLNKDAKRLFSISNAYCTQLNTTPEALGWTAYPDYSKNDRLGYFSVSFKSKTATQGIAGASYLKSVVVKDSVNTGVYQTIEEVRDAHPDKNTMWIEECQYQIVNDEMLPEVMKELWSYPILSFDTETTGLNINFMSREGLADQLVGVCISGKPGTGYYFPVQHKLFDNLCDNDHRYFMNTYMKELLETKPIICHNLSYDWKVAYIYNINVNCVFDTLLAFGVTMRYERLDCPLGLKPICSSLFKIDMFEIEDFVIGKWEGSGITFADLPYDLVEHYGPADADITLRVYNWCIETKLLQKYNAERVFKLEVNFAKVVAYSEFWGYHIDVAQLPALEEDINSGMEREKKELFALAGREFNPNSSQQLSKIIYDELYPDLIKSGTVAKKSTSKDILHELEGEQDQDGNPRYPFISHLIEYRRYEGTYKNFLKKKDQYVSPAGFVFAGVQQLGTNTGRVSIKDPNYQSYNDVVKKRVTGRPGYYIFDCDFAQIEYRVLASMAGQDALIKAFDDPDLDYHTHQAARMFSIPYAAVSKQLRQQSKGINFGLPYGMGDESLGKRVFGARTPENTAKAADLRKRFFAGQEKIQDFFTRVRDQGVKNGYTETWLGRRRYYHKEVFSEAAIRRQAGNHVIQGTAADIWKFAVTRFFNRIVKEGLLGKVLFNCFVHDELMGEVSVDIDPYVFIKMWREEYEVIIDKFCRLYAGFGWGNSWYEAKKADYPPQFIDTLVAKAGVDTSWDGDYKKLISKTKQDLYDFETWRVKDWYEHAEQGTILAPHIGGYLYDKVGDWWEDICKSDPDACNYVLKAKKDNTKPVATLNQVFKWFCQHENIEYKPDWVLSPDAAPAPKANNSAVEEEVDDDETQRLEAEHKQLIVQQVYKLGQYLDVTYNVLYLRYDVPALRNAANILVSNFARKDAEGDIKLVLMMYDANGVAMAYPQNYSFSFKDFNIIQETVRSALGRA